MQGNGERAGQILVRQLTNCRSQAHGRHGHVALGKTKAGTILASNLTYGLHHALVVGQWLTHAHEDHVGQAAAFCRHCGCSMAELLNDLARGQVTVQTALAGSTERAGHTAAGLGGNTQRSASWVAHQNRLQQRAIMQTPQGLSGLAVIRGSSPDRLHEFREESFLDCFALAGGDIGHILHIVGIVLVIVLSQLLCTEFRQANFCELVNALGFGQVREVLRGKSAARGREVKFHWLSHSVAHFSTVCMGFSN